EMYVMPSDVGPARELRPEFGAAGYPIWAPDSSHILFLGNRDPNAFQESATDWWVTPIEDGPVIRTGAIAAFRNPGFVTVSQVPEVWTPNGTGVLMSAALADTRNLWQVPISSRNWKVSGSPRRLTSGTIMDLQPSVAGSHVVFASLNGSIDIWSLPINADQA